MCIASWFEQPEASDYPFVLSVLETSFHATVLQVLINYDRFMVHKCRLEFQDFVLANRLGR